MPWSEKQNRLFRAIAHGWHPPAGSGIHIKRADASRMAAEGVKRASGGLALYAEGGQARRMDNPPPFKLDYGYPSLPPRETDTELRRFHNTLRYAGGGSVQAGGGDVDLGLEGGGDPRLDPRTRALQSINKRLKQQMSFESAQRASADITAPLRRINTLTLPHLTNSWAAYYMTHTPLDTELNAGHYPVPGTPPAQSMFYADGGVVNKGPISRLDVMKYWAKHPIDRVKMLATMPDRDLFDEDMGYAENRRDDEDAMARAALGAPHLGGSIASPLHPMNPASPWRWYAKGGVVTPRARRTIDMTEDGRVVVRHTFFGDTPAEAEHMLRSHRKADRSFDDAMAGKPYKGIDIRARKLAGGGLGYARGGYADGGETDERNFLERHPILTGIGAASAMIRPRAINSISRPFMRALAKPLVSTESVSKMPLPRETQLDRFDLARDAAMSPHKNLPVHDLQGAWMGDNGMEFNRLYAQELPRRLGRISGDTEGLRYAGQLGENLEQAAVPYNRFVPHLWNTTSDANAMMIHGVDDQKLRRLAEVLGPDVVTAHRPGSKALVFPLKDQHIGDLADEANATLGFPHIRFGRSDPMTDRVLLSREPWADMTYQQAGADPRDGAYDAFDRALIERGTRRAQRK